MLRLIFAIQFIITFQRSIILIFSTEMQPIYPISKQEVSMNFDCNFQANDLLHIDSLTDLNQTDTSWVLTHAGTSRKPSASYITDQRETQLMSVRAQNKQRLHNQGLMVVLKLVVDYSNAKFRSKKVIK